MNVRRAEGLRWLGWSMAVVIATPLVGGGLRLLGGPAAAIGTWLPFAALAIFILAGSARMPWC